MDKFIKISFFSYIFLLPSYLLKIPVWENCSVPLLDILASAFILVSIVRLKQSYSLKQLFKIFEEKQFLPFLFIITGFTVSYLINLDTLDWQNGLGIIKSFLLLPIISSLCFVLLQKSGVLNLKSIILPLSISSGMISFLGYLYAILGKLTFDGRLKIFFESSNQLAIYLSIGFLCTILLIKRSVLSKSLFLFLSLVFLFSQFFCIYLTRSSGALIGIFLALPIVFLSAKNLYKYKMLILLLVLLLSFMAFSSSSILPWTSYKQSVPATSVDSRITIYAVSHKIILNNLFWGIGPGSFQDVYLDYQKYFPPYPQWAVPHTHNNILHFWSEGGVLAFLGIVMILFNLTKTKKQTSSEMLAACLILTYLFVHGIFDNTIWKNDLSVIFWMFTSYAMTKKN